MHYHFEVHIIMKLIDINITPIKYELLQTFYQ